jgi:hypothetical protein
VVAAIVVHMGFALKATAVEQDFRQAGIDFSGHLLSLVSVFALKGPHRTTQTRNCRGDYRTALKHGGGTVKCLHA